MHNDKWHAGFSGMLTNWYLNYGQGAFKVNNYGEGETDDMTFGYKFNYLPPSLHYELEDNTVEIDADTFIEGEINDSEEE